VSLWHVFPVEDLRKHVTDQGFDCWCKPLPHEDDDSIVLHNSMDGREAFETGERKPS
jgi:hypothetical protein